MPVRNRLRTQGRIEFRGSRRAEYTSKLPITGNPFVHVESRKVVLITGAGGALGSQLALQCARAGCEVVLIDRKLESLDIVHQQIHAATGLDPIMQPLDLATLDIRGCEELVDALQNGPGRLDALVHCAATFEGLQPIDQIDPRSWLTDFQVNVHAAWLLSVKCLPMLRQAPAGNLFFLTENLERVSGAYWGCYGVSKWAIEAMARQFSAELRNTPVRVLAIDPGPMRSELRAKAYHAEDPSLVRSAAIPAARICDLLAGAEWPDGFHVDLISSEE